MSRLESEGGKEEISSYVLLEKDRLARSSENEKKDWLEASAYWRKVRWFGMRISAEGKQNRRSAEKKESAREAAD